MKKFILSKILLLSTKEKKAKKVEFDPVRTIILGKNETGKSSLLKSIYNTFGATPAKQSGRWKELNPISYCEFSIDSEVFSILKDGKYYAVFNETRDLIEVFDNVTNGLGPFIASKTDFKVKLINQDGKLITPPPAFLFLPFYIDQDASWQEAWKSFSNLSQIKKYKRPIIEYHVGLRPNEYYEAKGEMEAIETKIEELEHERRISQSILNKLKEKMTDEDLNIDLEDFKDELGQLLIECENLRVERDKIKNRLVDLFNLRIRLETQMSIAKQALNEARKDFDYAALEVEDNIDCPTCGAHYENNFIERFEIALDENRCKDLMIEINRELSDVREKIDKENAVLNTRSKELLRIEELLERKKGEVRLKDLIESQGKKELKSIFQESIDQLQKSIVDNAFEQKKLKDKIKALENKDRKDNIRNDYRMWMYRYVHELGLNLSEDDYKDLTRNISNTGSALPRSLTAYYFAILNLIKKYSTAAFCPIIIDSPNQQGQDFENIDKILLFIKNNQPDDSQLILGLENTFNIDFGYKQVVLEEKYSLLQEGEYESVHNELTPFLNKIWASGKKGKLF